MAAAPARAGRRLRVLALPSALVWALACATATDSVPEPAALVVEEEALAVLARMSDFLGAQQRFHFDAEVAYDAVQETGQKIEFGSTRSLTVRRPDRFRIDATDRHGVEQVFSFDGERLSGSIPAQHVYATIEIGGTLQSVLDHLTGNLAVPTPLADLVHPSLYAEIESEIESAIRVGSALIGGHACDHVAFRTPRVDFQIWVRRGPQPLPQRIVITYREAAGLPQFRARLSGWELEAEAPDASFRFAPPLGAQRVSFHELLELALESPGREDWE